MICSGLLIKILPFARFVPLPLALSVKMIEQFVIVANMSTEFHHQNSMNSVHFFFYLQIFDLFEGKMRKKCCIRFDLIGLHDTVEVFARRAFQTTKTKSPDDDNDNKFVEENENEKCKYFHDL